MLALSQVRIISNTWCSDDANWSNTLIDSTNILVSNLQCNGSQCVIPNQTFSYITDTNQSSVWSGISVGSLGQFPGVFDIVENVTSTYVHCSWHQFAKIFLLSASVVRIFRSSGDIVRCRLQFHMLERWVALPNIHYSEFQERENVQCAKWRAD